jgi:GH24 family phage-related lysozyme (muramidase)
MATFPSSETDANVRNNILRHIRKEEGMKLAPYADPNYQQANIGMGHTFYFFDDADIAAARKLPRAKKEAYLLSKLPEHLKKLRWTEEKAYEVLLNDYTVHRNRAKKWLNTHGMDDDGRLVDQLGMLFYGSKAQYFMDSRSAKKAIEDKDYDALSQAASRFGRTADGVPLAALAARRNAERAFYLGNTLPEKKDAPIKMPDRPYPTETKPTDVWGKIRAMEKKRTERAPGTLTLSDDEIDDDSAMLELMAGTRAKRRADQLVWDMMLHPGQETPPPMPEDFDSTRWASEIVAGRPPRPEWRGSASGAGIDLPTDVRELPEPARDPEKAWREFGQRAEVNWGRFIQPENLLSDMQSQR